MLGQLLALEVVQYAVGAHRERDDQFVELVQISADVAHPIGGADQAKHKLAGAQLANFGGFYKKSWRASDWMFGRLDGSNRMLRVLLNPARGAAYPGDVDRVVDALARIAVPDDAAPGDRSYLFESWLARQPGVRRELAYLQDPDVPVPEQLPATAEARMLRHQLEVLRDEMPVVVATAQEDRNNGTSDKPGASSNLIASASRLVAGAPADWRALGAAELAGLFARTSSATSGSPPRSAPTSSRSRSRRRWPWA